MIVCVRRLIGVVAFLLSMNVFAGVEEEGQTVSIKKFEFIPKEITIKKGESILWVNNEKRQYHSVWFEQAGDPEPEYFFPDETYSREFKEAGSFPYRCGPHPDMTGVVHVLE